MEDLGVSGLVAVVELESYRAGELVDELLRIHELECPNTLLEELRGLVEKPDVCLDLPGGGRALDLDDNVLPVGKHRAVHLPDRRRGDRRELELQERTIHRQAELGLDDSAYLLERNRRGIVLEPTQLGDDVGRNDVRPRREQLAELDERRPELIEHLAQPASSV